MRVLMLGWEFPPFFAGGVGVVCEALTRALVSRGHQVTYLMPFDPTGAPQPRGVKLLGAVPAGAELQLAVAPVPGTLLEPYAPIRTAPANASPATAPGTHVAAPSLYGGDLLARVDEFARHCAELVREQRVQADLIHAHDWTTFRAGLVLREQLGVPLIAHVHITEYDKSGGDWADPGVWALEREGMACADLVVAVSERVRRCCVERYGIPAQKVRVVYNAVDPGPAPAVVPRLPEPLVLFLGRVTRQKGPEYFLEAARRVLEAMPEASFVMAGTGDQLPALIERAAALGLSRKFLFSGFVDREQAAALYSRADVFVMPSASEPFGIVALEAMERGVPVIVSRQSGVSELVRNALKVDFWNVEELASSIVAALRYPVLASELRRRAASEVRRITWDAVAHRIAELYREQARA
jgi:glycosyltransferase involved in cell wall biosynthesis